MEKLTEGQMLDGILKYCLENDNTDLRDISKHLYPELNDDQVKHLFKKIDDFNNGIAKIHISLYNATIEPTGLTQNFLDQNGFVELENQDKSELERVNEMQSIELSLAKSNIEANELNKRNSKFNKKVNVANIIVGVVNILVAIGLACWSYKVGLLK